MIINLHRRLVLLVTVVGLLFVATATSQEPKPHPASNSNMSVATPDRLKWMPIRPGNEMAIVYGDPSKTGELYAVRFRFADGFKVPAHWHPQDEHATVLQARFCSGWAPSGMLHS